ncbi:MAG: hypothetical protein C5B49_00485 [Bdellovibrio sp.]|nr:MAG: hypothetical protein C5B49_00485 [Bdellovibrio sp.]
MVRLLRRCRRHRLGGTLGFLILSQIILVQSQASVKICPKMTKADQRKLSSCGFIKMNQTCIIQPTNLPANCSLTRNPKESFAVIDLVKSIIKLTGWTRTYIEGRDAENSTHECALEMYPDHLTPWGLRGSMVIRITDSKGVHENGFQGSEFAETALVEEENGLQFSSLWQYHGYNQEVHKIIDQLRLQRDSEHKIYDLVITREKDPAAEDAAPDRLHCRFPF